MMKRIHWSKAYMSNCGAIYSSEVNVGKVGSWHWDIFLKLWAVYKHIIFVHMAGMHVLLYDMGFINKLSHMRVVQMNDVALLWTCTYSIQSIVHVHEYTLVHFNPIKHTRPMLLLDMLHICMACNRCESVYRNAKMHVYYHNNGCIHIVICILFIHNITL